MLRSFHDLGELVVGLPQKDSFAVYPACNKCELALLYTLLHLDTFNHRVIKNTFVLDHAGFVHQADILWKDRYQVNGLCLTGPAAGYVCFLTDSGNHSFFEIDPRYCETRNQQRIEQLRAKAEHFKFSRRQVEQLQTNPFSNNFLITRPVLNYPYLHNWKEVLIRKDLQQCGYDGSAEIFAAIVNQFQDTGYYTFLFRLLDENGYSYEKSIFETNIKLYLESASSFDFVEIGEKKR